MNSNLNPLPQCAAELSQELTLQADLDGPIFEANFAWGHILGWSEDELRVMNFFDLVHPDDIDKARAATERATAGAAPLVFDNRYRHKDGSYRWISWRAVAHANCLYATGRDITAEKDAIEALRECQDTVRHLQKMDSIGQLSGGIAHDFNNSLQSIVSAMELVLKLIAAGRSGESERFIASAIAAAHGAAAMNQRLLSFLRREPLDPKPTKMNELITGMEEVLRRSLPNSIKVSLDLSPELWETHCDGKQAENAVLNLAVNARDAMPLGGTLSIQTSNAEVQSGGAAHSAGAAPGQYVRVTVTDTGTGMGEEVAERAFDAFFTTKAKGQGSGLGLTMVHRFARQNDGAATIQSEPGRGTSVTFYLPRHQSGMPESA